MTSKYDEIRVLEDLNGTLAKNFIVGIKRVLGSKTLPMIIMIEETIFVIGRIIFGLVLAFFGLNHFMNLEQMKGYAEFKGVPAPGLAVIGTGLLLLIGGISIGAGIYPLVGIVALSIFFIGVTPRMHDFWNAEGEDKQNEMNLFLKNFAILGAVFMFAITLDMDWPAAIVG